MLHTLLMRLPLLIIVLLFPLAGTLVLGRIRHARTHMTIPLFAALNVSLTFCLFLTATWRGELPRLEAVFFLGPAIYYAAYLGIALVEYALVRRATTRGPLAWRMAIGFPLLALILIRYVFEWRDPFAGLSRGFSLVGTAGMFLGISYMAFRVVRMVFEVRNQTVPMPTAAEYLAFVFFSPTMSIGPITTYSMFRRSLYTPDYAVTPAVNSALRIVKGLAKYLLVASLLSQVAYTGLMLDGHQHGLLDLCVAAVAYYLFLYCNFSGFSDVVIGSAGLIGIQVDENFRNPMSARNIQEFWNRWHMSLSFLMRDLVFQPMSKWFIRRLGPARAKEAMVIPILTIFLLIGVWHGPQWNYLLFGAAHGVGVVFIIYLTDAMRKSMGNVRYRQYLANVAIRRLAVAATFCYVAATHFLFANTIADMRLILATLR